MRIKNKSLVFIFTLIIFCAASARRARCAYEDAGLGARAMGMGNAFTAVGGDVSSFAINPAGLGGARKAEIGTHFFRTFRGPAGATDLSEMALGGVYPSAVSGRPGSFGVIGRVGTLKDFSRDKQLQFGYGTWQLLKTGWGVLDFGGGLKILQRQALAGGDSASAAAFDAGAVLRTGSRYAFGMSLLNINSPAMDLSGVKDKAPFAFRVGASDQGDDYTLSVELAQRAGSSGADGGYSLNSGIEYWWKTYRRGVLGTRTGVSLGNRSSVWAFGLSYRHLGAELHYGIMLPLSGTFNPGHAVSVLVRFGHRDAESEYERLLKQEMRYRSDLVEVLGEAERREKNLRTELAELRLQLEELQQQLKDRELRAEDALRARNKLERMMESQRKAEAELREIGKKREEDRLKSAAAQFNQDWESYLKLKSGGAPKSVLQGALQRILREYQGAGIDISPASMELRNVIGAQ